MSLLAVDMGSTNCKAVAFSEDGRVLAQKSISYAVEATNSPGAEMPPEKFWEALAAVTQQVAVEVNRDRVEVLAISSHGETFVPVDSRNNVVRPAILNRDGRAVSQAAWLAREIGKQKIFEITGLAVHSMYPLPKILWLLEHEPAAFHASARFLSLPTYLLTRMGLPPYIDYSLACRFLAFDIRKLSWSAEILPACGLSAEQFPIPVPTGTIAGTLTTDIAKDLGLPTSTLVVVGGHDQPCAALGCGVMEPGRISASLGTYECLLVAARVPMLSEAGFAANLNTYCDVVPGRYVTLAYFPSGIMIEWFLHLIGSSELTSPASQAELCAALEANSSQRPTGLCITPHLLGTCNPDFDPAASGVVAGIRPSTNRADLYKGILEGIACEFANMTELLQHVAGECGGVYISGGGGRSRLGLRLRAALSGRELHQMRCPEAVCLGTAMLAGVAAGKYSDLAQAVQQVVQVAETISPEKAIRDAYRGQMERYRILYSSLAPVRRAEAGCS